MCSLCTVPTDGTDLCKFCQDYDGAPVDSATRPCCGGIGGHARHCPNGDERIAPMPTSALPNLPAGATNAIEALDDTHVVFSERHHTAGISVCATTVHDGHRLETATVQLGGGNQELTPAQARELANALQEAAALAEQWTASANN